MKNGEKNVRTKHPMRYSVSIHHVDSNEIVGTGVLISTVGQIVTCAHVIEDAGVDPHIVNGKEIPVCFVSARSEEAQKRAKVAACFSQSEDDIVLLKLTDERVPLGPEVIPTLGKAENSFYNEFVSFGFGQLGEHQGTYAAGRILGCEPSPEKRAMKVGMVQLETSQISGGMSGAGVLDTERNLLVGIISETWIPDQSTKNRDTGWAVNARILTFDPFNVPVSDEAVPKAPAPQPKTDVAAARKAAAKAPGIVWNNAPPSIPEWVGRNQLLEDLTSDWGNPRTRITGLIGFGGEGKSSLARRWVDKLLSGKKNKPDGVFWWGFYTKPNVDEFFEAALKYLSGNKIDPRKLPSSNTKAQVIGAMLGAGRYLFVLDGLEILQNQKGARYGLLQSRDLLNFLELFAGSEVKSFCLITSRAPIFDLMNYTTYKHRDVDRLLLEDGRDLLRKLGVDKGKDAQLDKVVKDWDGHALTLSLLGSCIAEMHAGDISKAGDIEIPKDDEDRYERVHRILRRYDEHLDEAERAFMTLFSAFRTPVKESAFEKVFRTKTGATALNAPIAELSREQFDAMIKRLQSYRILRYDERDKSYSAHPLIRDHYLAILTKKTRKKDQKDAHVQITDYYLKIAGDTPENPTLDDLMPLIEVVHHLCQAGAYDEAHEIRAARIEQEDRFVLCRQLGAYEVDLELTKQFFPEGDTSQEPQVTQPIDKAWILNEIGRCLIDLGQLDESENSCERAALIYKRQENWKSTSIVYQNLSDLHTLHGALKAGIDFANEAFELAGKAEDESEKRDSLTYRAWAAYLGGDMKAAGEDFKQSEAIQQEIAPDNTSLYGLSGIRHADFLRRTGETGYARKVTKANLNACESYSVADTSQCHRVLGDLDADAAKHNSAREHYDEALKIARSITHRPSLIGALLARGRWYAKYMNDPQAAFSDLDEALDCATDGGYRIYEANIRIALAWAYLRDENPDRAKAEVQRALQMSEEMGYHWGKVDAQEVLQELEKQK